MEICRIVRRRTGLPAEAVRSVVDELFGTLDQPGAIVDPGLIQEAVATGHDVDIRGFGKFDRRERKARSYASKIGVKGKGSASDVQRPKHHVPYFVPNYGFKRYVRATAAKTPTT